MADDLTDDDYARLARFRFELRRFLNFSEQAAIGAGLTAQQYQGLLALRGAGEGGLRIGQLADELLLKPHSASGLVDRLAEAGYVVRIAAEADRRRVLVRLTQQGKKLLRSLVAAHRSELRRLRPMLRELIEKV